LKIAAKQFSQLQRITAGTLNVEKIQCYFTLIAGDKRGANGHISCWIKNQSGSRSRNPVNNSVVIPGKLAAIPPKADQPKAEASATRNPGKSKLLDTRFRGYDGWGPADRNGLAFSE
jgi:hypothetical protein